jgi:2-methylisocitrate lyase-like PEP mutase family enzyme
MSPTDDAHAPARARSDDPAGDLSARRVAFARLHEQGCFVIPNPWDVGSARYLAQAGFEALATTSGGMAISLGMPDGDPALSVDMVLEHVARIVGATDLPVNADFEDGHAPDAAGVAANVARCVEAGVAGLSIEDSTGDRDHPLRSVEESVERVQAARAAIDASGAQVLLTARAECHLVGHPDPLAESQRRLAAYAEAGADVVYAPGPTDPAAIAELVAAAGATPLNVLALASGPGVAELADLGVRRISLGSGLARAAWGGLQRTTESILETGSFAALDQGPTIDLNGLMRAWPPPR